jgi:hypothetical protein
MRQDDPIKKPHSLVADLSQTEKAFFAMKEDVRLRPLFL